MSYHNVLSRTVINQVPYQDPDGECSGVYSIAHNYQKYISRDDHVKSWTSRINFANSANDGQRIIVWYCIRQGL